MGRLYQFYNVKETGPRQSTCYAFNCYLPCHEVGVACNVLMSGTVHGICTGFVRCPVFVCLQIINFVNISGMDEATFVKFGRLVEYGRVHPRGEKFPLKGVSTGSVTLLKIFNSLNISEIDEATLFKFGN